MGCAKAGAAAMYSSTCGKYEAPRFGEWLPLGVDVDLRLGADERFGAGEAVALRAGEFAAVRVAMPNRIRVSGGGATVFG